MTIQVGDTLPETKFVTPTPDGPKPLTTAEVFAGKTVVLFAVPGAFTPTCSARHLPGYVEHAAELKAKGVDTIAVVSVNDAFVMGAWSKASDAGDILFLADGNGDFAKAIDLTLDGSGFGMGLRSQRYALVAKDGVVTHLFVEAPGEFKVSAADHVLASL